MAEMTPSDTNSPPNSALSRKNKLGYTRISVACAHCRRRKIRCVAADGDPEGRCSNCIKLKKDCIYTSVDANPNPSPSPNANADARSEPLKTGLSSQTPSAMSSRSPSGVEPDRYTSAEIETQGVPGVFPGGTPIGLPAHVGIMTTQGLVMPPNVTAHDAFQANRANMPEWQAHTLGMAQTEYQGQHYAVPWQNQGEQLRAFTPQGYARSPQELQYPYMNQAHAYATRPQQWAPQEHHATLHGQAGGVPQFAPEHHPMMYNEQYMQAQPTLASAPVVPSQYFAPGMNHGGEQLESQQPGWNVYQQVPSTAGQSSRHDSMATNWSRVHSNQGRVAGGDDDQQHPRATRRPKNPNEYPE
ncbi:hypothetical protein K461DRAFT_79638 [Myriangium duriaei CBS 260.36]|uniref:Zn(2)-C6 fungal-type domain-containing protein n=1 Tax=Myriangium duriaei CBS 260.36 TaxID=1168546 RepID=A0A9P4J6N7_9PEZI|nr:hypothetical protein K461DRAFT_79638 [Myriangium duriaei CBS 260.36]